MEIDPSLFPKLSTRRALIVVDAQTDFLSEDGALHVGMPVDLTTRIVKLVKGFRPHGDIVWIRSEYDQPRSVTSEQIITSDAPAFGNRRPTPRGRRPPATGLDQPLSRCPEAFLSGDAPGRPECVRMGTPGADFPAAITQIMERKDLSFVKKHYSAFKSPQLIQRLEMKFVNEVFICGSLSNMGVMATAIDAASHGLDIAIIEDCCGRRSSVRHNNALKKITETTGCEVMSAQAVLNLVTPKVKPEPRTQPQAVSAAASAPVPALLPAEVPAAPGPVAVVAQSPAVTSLPVVTPLPVVASSPAVTPLPVVSPSPGVAPLPVVTPAPAPAPAVARPSAGTPAPLTPTKTTGRRYPAVYERSSGETSPTKPSVLVSSFAKMSLGGQSNAGLSNTGLLPLTYIRAGAAARLAKVLPRIENQLKGKVSISAMNASPNDDMNASSSESDDSQDDGPMMVPVKRSQPQTGAQRTEKKASETNATLAKNIDQRSEIGVESALRQLKLGAENSNRPETISKPPNEDPGPSEKGPQDTKSIVSATKVSEVNTKDRHSTTMDPKESNLGETEPLCEGDTKVLYNVLPQPLSDGIFTKVQDEVQWLRMSHQGGEVPRLVAVQGEVDQDGNIPIYRHPADESPPLLPWTPAVKDIRDAVEKKVGHSLNHALIQFYRDGNDYISEHSDKTLDIVKDSFIVNVSLGAERTMVLRTKRQPKQKDSPPPQAESVSESLKREIQRARLPHNSMCQMGLQTNMRWLHAIRQDKRLDREKSEGELAYEGARISLTFRKIGTFLDRDNKLIWGQGATSKVRDQAREVINGQTPEAVKMLQAFGRENHSSEFDWNEYYGAGFDVLHMSASPRLFTSSDPVANMRVQLMLAEYGIGYAKGRLAPVTTKVIKEENTSTDAIPEVNHPPIKLIDNDSEKSSIHGDVAIMLYLDRFYSKSEKAPSQADLARQFTRFNQALLLGAKLRSSVDLGSRKAALASWETYAGEADFISGSLMTIVDFAFWPVLHDAVGEDWKVNLSGNPNLAAYYERIRNRESGVKVMGEGAAINKTSTKESPRKETPTPKTPSQAPSRGEAPAVATRAKRGAEHLDS